MVFQTFSVPAHVESSTMLIYSRMWNAECRMQCSIRDCIRREMILWGQWSTTTTLISFTALVDGEAFSWPTCNESPDQIHSVQPCKGRMDKFNLGHAPWLRSPCVPFVRMAAKANTSLHFIKGMPTNVDANTMLIACVLSISGEQLMCSGTQVRDHNSICEETSNDLWGWQAARTAGLNGNKSTHVASNMICNGLE